VFSSLVQEDRDARGRNSTPSSPCTRVIVCDGEQSVWCVGVLARVVVQLRRHCIRRDGRMLAGRRTTAPNSIQADARPSFSVVESGSKRNKLKLVDNAGYSYTVKNSSFLYTCIVLSIPFFTAQRQKHARKEKKGTTFLPTRGCQAGCGHPRPGRRIAVLLERTTTLKGRTTG